MTTNTVSRGAVKKPVRAKLTPEEKALKDAEAEAARLKKEAEKAKRAAAREAAKIKKAEEAEKAKAKAEAEKEKAAAVVQRKLTPVAKEINVRFEKANKLVAQADDHRLAASLKLAEAKDQCEEAGLKFAEWCEENVKQAYETVRKLIPIGYAERDTEGAGAAMLEDMRAKNAAANKKHREKKAAEAQATLPKPTGEAPPAEEPTVEPEEEGEEVAPPREATPLEHAQQAFQNLGRKAKVSFAIWVAQEVGGTFSFDDEAEANAAEAEADLNAIPDFLKRT